MSDNTDINFKARAQGLLLKVWKWAADNRLVSYPLAGVLLGYALGKLT